MTYSDLRKLFIAHEAQKPNTPLRGLITFTEGSFDRSFPRLGRTYLVGSRSKAYMPGMSGYSIFGHSLDGTDPHVCLEAYMQAERGGSDGWTVEDCQLVQGAILISEEDAKEYLEWLSEPEADAENLCPRCGAGSIGPGGRGRALSRRADAYICTDCGTEEALWDMYGQEPLPFNRWAVIRTLIGKVQP